MATLNPDAGAPYRVPPEPSRLPSILLAVAMHAVLLFFLWAGVNWQSTPPVSVEAEVWDMQTEAAGPPPPPPVPQPEPEPAPRPEPRPEPPPPVKAEEPPAAPKPDIALERQKKEQKAREQKLAEEKIEREKEELKKKKELEKKLLAEQKAKELADKKAAEKADKLAKAKLAAAEEKKMAQLRAAEMQRITGSAGSGEASRSSAPRADSSYYAAISAKIRRNLIYAGSTDVPGDPRAEFLIQQLPTGEIISVRKTKSSGIPAYDEAVENAIAASSPLPKKKDGTVERSVPAMFKLKDSSN